MDGENIISIREFARRVSSSEGNIRKAIKAGKISKGLKSGKIVYDVALSEYKEWYGHKMPEVILMPKSKKVVESKPKKVIIKKPVEVKEIKVKAGFNLPIVEEVEQPKKSVIEIIEPTTNEQEIEQVDLIEEKTIRIGNKTKYEEAKRLEQVIKTRTAQLEYEQLKGSLVSSKEVYKELYAVGQTVRSSLQGIPDKYIDNILACETRIEAHEMLNKAITDALEELSNAVKEADI